MHGSVPDRATALAALLLAALAPPPAAAAPTAPLTFDTVVHADTGLGEPQVRVNPRDPSNLVIGENDSGVSISHDRGASWRQVSLPNPGDNVVAARPDGSFAYSSLDGRLRVSADGGDSWTAVGNWVGAAATRTQPLSAYPLGSVAARELSCNAPQPAGPVAPRPEQGPGPHAIGCDRPWLSSDASTGTLYVSFTDHADNSGGASGRGWELGWLGCKATVLVSPVFACGRQYVASSHDGGRSWSPFVPFDSADYAAGSTGGFSGGPVASAGVLASAYVAGSAAGVACDGCAIFETSRDDGVSWMRHRVPASVAAATVLTTDASTLFAPYSAADPSRPGRFAVMLFDAAQRSLLVFVTTDAGATWQGPARLGEVPTLKRYDPWIAYGPTGALGVVWRTAYPDGSYAAWATVAPAGDVRFARPVRLSSAPSPGPVNQLAGDDASSVALDDRYLHAAWGDRRTGKLGIRYGRYDFAADPAVRAQARGG